VATGNGSVTGIGREKAGKIWYRALDVYMTASETFAKARLDTIKSAEDLYGVGSAEANAVAAAWTAVNRP
jgi:Zn-dependent metalloprotease